MLACFDVPSTIPIGLAACDGFFEPKEKAKYLDKDTLGLEALQPIEIPQNGQKLSLEKLGGKQPRFGKAWRKAWRRWRAPEPHFAAPMRHAALVFSTAPMGIAIGASKRKRRSSSHSRAGAVIRLEPD